MTRVQVDPSAFEASCAVIGNDVATAVMDALTNLVVGLAQSGGMAGSDPGGLSWAQSYDRAAHTVLSVGGDVVNACYRLAALLQQTGFNYGRAEQASTPGGDSFGPVRDRSDYADRYATFSGIPSAVGSAGSGPTGWGVIEHLVGYVWPNGQQGQLRRAAGAWRAAARSVELAGDDVLQAIFGIQEQQVPEVADAETACRAMRQHLSELAAMCESVADACEAYAARIDHAHSEIERELAEFIAWSAVIEGAGALAAIVTAGASEGAAQVAEASRLAATAARVRAIIEGLLAAGRAIASAIGDAAASAARITSDLNPLLASRVVVASREFVVTAHAARTAAEAAEAAKAAREAGKAAHLATRAAEAAEADSRLILASTLELSRVPEADRAEVIRVIERAKIGKKQFTGHDGKLFQNRKGGLPLGRKYTEWTPAGPHGGRWPDARVILEGDETNPTAIYYWDHHDFYVRIGP